MDNLHSSKQPTHQAQEEATLRVPAGEQQLQAMLAILNDPNQRASPAELKKLLTAIENRLSSIDGQLPENQQAIANVSMANAESAASHPSEIERCAKMISLGSSVFNRLAASLPEGQLIKTTDLIEDWSSHQAHANPRYIVQTISRLVEQGVLEYVGNEHVRRTPVKIELKGDKALLKTCSEPTRHRELITPPQIVTYINTLPKGTSFLQPLNRPYQKSHDDQLRLVSACALGRPCTEVGAIWAPRIAPQATLKILQAKTGMSITPLRNEVYNELVKGVVEKLTNRIGAIAIRTIPSVAAAISVKDPTTAGKMVSQAARKNDPHSLSNLQHRFQLTQIKPEEFVTIVLVQSKEYLFEVLQESPLLHLIGQQGARKLETVQYSQQPGENLSSAGRKFNITREAVRQHLEHIKSIHPLVRAILESNPSSNVDTLPELSESLIKSLREEITNNPEAAFARGSETSAEPSPEPNESEDAYLRRIFLEAFAGRYLDGQSSKHSFPTPLQTLQPSPKRFFKDLVYECINQRMKDARRNYSPSLSSETLTSLYESDTSHLLPRDYSITLQYIRELVNHPGEKAHEIWGRITPQGTSRKNGEKIKVLLDPIYRKLGKQRAKTVCGVLGEPWCSAWLPPKPQRDLIQVRIIEQNSVAKTCKRLGIPRGTFSMTWARVGDLMPVLRSLTPRKVYAEESDLG